MCYSLPVVAAMLEDSDPVGTPRRLLDPFSSARTVGHNSHFGTHLPPPISLSFQSLSGTHFATPFFSNSCRNVGGCTPFNFQRSNVQTFLAPINPLDATLMNLPATVANKRLTSSTKPFRCNTYKNHGGYRIAQSQGCGRPRQGTSRIEIKKLPFFRPTTSKFAEFSVPPLLEARTGLPPVSSAISGARFRASNAIFAAVPRTWTLSARCSSGFKGAASPWSSSTIRVRENGGAWRFAHEMSTAAPPGCKSAGGSTTSTVGKDASTIADCPAIVTRLASASPQKPFPRISKRSVSEATRGAAEISIAPDAASSGVSTAVATRPVRPAIEPKITPGFSGATNNALPVASVVSRSPFEALTVTPGVSRPFTSSTASVARSPETMRLGSSNIRAPEAAGAAAGCWALVSSAKTPAIRNRKSKTRPVRGKDMRGIVVENRMPMKAQHGSVLWHRLLHFFARTGASTGL